MLVGSIDVQTNDETQTLRLEDIEKYEDGSGYSCLLKVRSRGFACDRRFYFDDRFLSGFINGIEGMDSGQPGQATLKGTWETDELMVEMYASGRVIIRGEMTEHSSLTQQLRFALQTDQTLLRPLILSLRALTKA